MLEKPFATAISYTQKMRSNSRFDTTETEIIRFFAEHGAGKKDALGVTLLSQAVHNGAAGIAQVQHFSNLIEALSGSIIAGSPERSVLPTLWTVV